MTSSTVTSPSPPAADAETVDLLVYSDDVDTRRTVIEAVGRRPGKGLPIVRWTQAATHAAVIELVESRSFALVVLDGEAAKVGGMAVARQLKTEIYDSPPVLLLIARPQDRWLASWSEAERVVSAPLDPMELQEAVAGLLRSRSEQ